jgi:DNA-binding transcriptional ArsR family regulator
MASDPLSITFSALADPTRRSILEQLTRGEATVNELAQPHHISLPAVSKHLKVLEKAGLVVIEQGGAMASVSARGGTPARDRELAGAIPLVLRRPTRSTRRNGHRRRRCESVLIPPTSYFSWGVAVDHGEDLGHVQLGIGVGGHQAEDARLGAGRHHYVVGPAVGQIR